MKRNSILICLLFAIAANFITPTAKAQVNTTDSLALVDLYHRTNGRHWRYYTNWLTANPVSTWYGIKVTGSRVTHIFLSSNRLNGTIPSSIGNLDQLDTLDLTYNRLSGTIHPSIGNLINLKELDLSGNQLSGAIPAEIGNLANLQTLSLNFNQLTGAIPKEIGNLSNLLQLDLISNQLSGSIPAEIGNLANLQSLVLVYNKLSGAIPKQIGNLAKLQVLNLGTNQLSGAIPASIGNLLNLGGLDLSINQLSGAIPAKIGNLVNLVELDLNSNKLTGAIPAEIGNFANLYQLYMQNNQLSGTIPSEIGKLVKLQYLYLNNNQLSGVVPASFKNLTRLFSFSLSYNQLTKFANANAFSSVAYEGYVNNNLFTFNGLQAIAENNHNIVYAPQDTILPIHKSGNVLSVSAGGTLSSNMYNWFKTGVTDSTSITGDSTFHPTSSGRYYAKVTNAIATMLTLYTDTINYTLASQSNATFLAENTAQIKSADSKFLVYPNPAKDIIHIQVNGNAIVTLTNSAGKILFSKSINNDSEINVSSYANGVYYLQNKTTGETQKIVVVH